MLTDEMKRKIFMKLRAENYRASLRLEGMTPRPVAIIQQPHVVAGVSKPKHGG